MTTPAIVALTLLILAASALYASVGHAGASVGGWIDAEYGRRRLNNVTIRRLLALVLVIGGLKLILI